VPNNIDIFYNSFQRYIGINLILRFCLQFKSLAKLQLHNSFILNCKLPLRKPLNIIDSKF